MPHSTPDDHPSGQGSDDAFCLRSETLGAMSSPPPPTACCGSWCCSLARSNRCRPRTVATRLGLPRSTTYRLLGSLVEQGFVSYLPEERRYGLGVVTFEMGSATRGRRRCGGWPSRCCTGSPTGPGRTPTWRCCTARDVYYVIEQRAPRRRTLVTDVGVRLPATVTASGLAILAALPAAQVRAVFPDADALVDRAGHGPTTLRELRALLDVCPGPRLRRGGRSGHCGAGLGRRTGAGPDRLSRWPGSR